MSGLTNVSRDASDDDLAFVRRAHSISEIGIVPGVDLARTLNERHVGIRLQELSR